MQLAAILAAALLIVITVFQLALALGVPWGRAAWGGQHDGVLPTRLRVASGLAGLVVYPLIIAVVLASAEVVEAAWLPRVGRGVMWALAGLFTLGAVANVVSRSKPERIWGPASLLIAICCGIVATRM